MVEKHEKNLLLDCKDISCLFGREILIYGAGYLAGSILPYLCAMPKEIHLLGIALTDTKGEQPYQNTGLKIKNIHTWANEWPNATILVVTSDQYHDEISRTCRAEGYQTIIPLSSALRNSIYMYPIHKFLVKNGVDFSKRYIQLGNTPYLNPMQIEPSNCADLFAQFSDIVLPHCYHPWTMMNEGPYDPDGVLELTKGSIVLDCGANHGTFSAYAASKNCRCYAFEPTPALQPILQEYAGLYPGRIIPVECALSNQNGTTEFHLSNSSMASSSLLDRIQEKACITVSTRTLDSFVEQNRLPAVDFIKADIEGAERLMLEGAQKTLAKYAPKLSICTYHLSDDKQVLTELILKANPRYKIKYGRKKLYAQIGKEYAAT